MIEKIKSVCQPFISGLSSYIKQKRSIFSDEVHFFSNHGFLHFWVLVIRNFENNRCWVRAGALTFSSILALVPLLALTLGISASILKNQTEEDLRELTGNVVNYIAPQLILDTPSTSPDAEDESEIENEAAKPQRTVVDGILTFVNNFNSAQFGTVGVIGFLALALSMMITIEATLNDIWGIKAGRKWVARLVQYWTTLTLGTGFIIIAATSITVDGWLEQIPYLGSFLPQLFIEVFPILFVALAFTIVYAFMPNTRVDWSAALMGGVIGAALWQLNKSVSGLFFTGRFARDTIIYDSFAVVPIFFIGIYLSWLILLFGAQVAHAFQHRAAYVMDRYAERINAYGRELAAFRILTKIGRSFRSGDAAPSPTGISVELGLPLPLIEELATVLEEHRIIHRIDKPKPGLAPARPLHQISAHDIYKALRSGQRNAVEEAGFPMNTELKEALISIRKSEQMISKDITLEQLTEQTIPQPIYKMS